ncbi:MAG: hypothetical protein ACK559_37650, partial [bacterium]
SDLCQWQPLRGAPFSPRRLRTDCRNADLRCGRRAAGSQDDQPRGNGLRTGRAASTGDCRL